MSRTMITAARYFRGVAVRAATNAYGDKVFSLAPALARLLMDFAGRTVEVQVRAVQPKKLSGSGWIIRFR